MQHHHGAISHIEIALLHDPASTTVTLGTQHRQAIMDPNLAI